MFLTTSKFKLLHVKNHTGPGLSYDAWCKSIGCILQNVLFPYECFDSYEKQCHAGPVGYEDFNCSLNTKDKHKQFFKMFKENDCTTMGDWLRVCNISDLCNLLRPLGKWFCSTILIELMYAKPQLVSQVYQWRTYWTSLWRETRNLSHMHHETFATHHKIKKDEFQNCCCNDALKCDVHCVKCQLD